MKNKYFRISIKSVIASEFTVSITPIYFHRNFDDMPLHYHFVFGIGFWYIDIRIGKDRNYE